MTERKNMFPQVGADLSSGPPRVSVAMGEPGAVSGISTGELGGETHVPGDADTDTDDTGTEEGDGGGAGAIVAVAAVAAVAYFLYK